jgi:PAS domain S-box-containing protein
LKEKEPRTQFMKVKRCFVFYLINQPTSVYLLDDSGFTKVNASTVSALGYNNINGILSKFPWELSPEKQPDGTPSIEKAKSMVILAIEAGFHKFEWTHLKADRSELPVEVMLTPIRFKGKQYLYSQMRDISERKAREAEN